MPDNDHYFMEQGADETARQLRQGAMLTKVAGELFPVTIQPGWKILDAGCGPGGWLLDLVFQHRQQKVTGVGVDINPLMIEYAKSEASAQELADAVSFEILDIHPPLPFANNAFDVVNARLLGFFPQEFWPDFVAECYRITRPGGFIQLTETEMGVSNSQGLENWHEWFFQALFRAGQSFSPNGHRLCMTALLAPLLRKAGLQGIQTRASAIEWGYGSEFYRSMFDNIKVASKVSQPFFLAQGLVTQEELDGNYEKMLEEMQREDFASVYYMFSAWGQK